MAHYNSNLFSLSVTTKVPHHSPVFSSKFIAIHNPLKLRSNHQENTSVQTPSPHLNPILNQLAATL